MYFIFFIPLINADWSFMHMADWGGDDAPTYTKRSQCRAGDAMEDIAAKYNVDTILAVGDNFYHYGVERDNADAYFENTFNKVYYGPMLNKAKFYAVAGNHDHRGDVEAQINYPLEKWVFPDYWYTFTKDIGNGMTAHFIMIDTVLLVGESYHDIENNVFVAATGPKNLQKAQSQWTFIEREMANSNADFLFVAGHYPVYSPCSHGSTTDLIRYLKPLLERYDVTAYIAGHDHCASYVDEGTGPVYPMNGMGDTCCYSGKKLTKMRKLVGDAAIGMTLSKQNAKDYGKPQASFNSYTLKPTGEMIIRFHDETGRVYYENSVYSIRARGYLSSAARALSELGIPQLALVGFSACIFGFFLTWCCFRRKKSSHPENLDLDLLESDQVRQI